ncbi:hypothetical protein NQ315_017043 [Exocentrus adspersus]|uniref:Uncharacterized protein n=1 Tax=Exocentrus adspersus TaxID=1586481 RepID=A0AAV8V5M3_9CUCU|nr:hypothetical protein NQ315_017043 [Exocentrus adspersus]
MLLSIQGIKRKVSFWFNVQNLLESVGGSSCSRKDSGATIARLSAENNELRKRVRGRRPPAGADRGWQWTEEAQTQKAASRHKEGAHAAPRRNIFRVPETDPYIPSYVFM